jgi:hypothetical protein
LNLNMKKTTAITLILLTATLMLASFASAQTSNQAIVTILPSTGGSTSPAPGTYNYDNGTTIVLTATPSNGFEFKYWVVSGEFTPGHTSGAANFVTDPNTGEIIQLPRPIATGGIDSIVFTANPANITCGYGYTFSYQAVFAPVTGGTPAPSPSPQTSPPTSNDQIINILPSVGGTTSPAAGTHTYTNGQAATLQATANSGFSFHYWIVTGSYTPGHQAQPQFIPGVTEQVPSVPQNLYLPTQDSLVFSVNPVTITCGYGYTYTYQAVFTPVGDTHGNVIPTATPPPTAAPTPVTATPTPVVTATPVPAAGTDYTWAIVAAVVVIIIIIIVVAAVMMRRKK